MKGRKGMKKVRKKFTMSDEQLKTILDACKPVPLIMLQCGMPKSPQENANEAWKALGKEMGFKYMTVCPVENDQKVFTAEPTEEAVDA